MSLIRKYTRIDRLFLITGILTLLPGLFCWNDPIDLAIHDTYFVISSPVASIVLCLPMLVFALVYYLFIRSGRKLLKSLNASHYLLTVLALPLIIMCFPSHSTRYIAGQSMSEEMENMARLNVTISAIVLLFLFGQLLFLVNIALALFRKKNP